MRLFSRILNGYTLLSIFLKQEARRIRGQKIITVIGDSHCLLFQDEIFSIKYIGPATAYNLINKKSTTKSRGKIIEVLSGLNQNSDVMFVFGEIDCRIHIYRIHKSKKIPINKVVSSTVDSYVQFILEMRTKYPKMNFVICGVFPQGEQGNFYGTDFYADRKVRMNITKVFNFKLEVECGRNNIKYFSIFDKLIDKREERIKKFVHDEIHFNKKILPFILWELKKLKILK